MKTEIKYSQALNELLWVAQAALAVMFIIEVSGYYISYLMPWTNNVPTPMVQIIGWCELIGATGLFVPALLEYKANLTSWAALGLATIMTIAIPFHIAFGQPHVAIVNLCLGSIAVFVACGRYKKQPFRNTFLICQLQDPCFDENFPSIQEYCRSINK